MAKQRVEVTITFTSTWEFDPEDENYAGPKTEDEVRDEVYDLVKPYLESPEGSLYSDYGPEAWGGYDGPTYIAGAVSRG